MIVTIDGPAGAGKSTVAQTLARRLGFRYLDTGAMYRTVALAGMRRTVDWERPEELARLAEQVVIEVNGQTVLLDGEDVTESIRSSEVTAVTRHAADNPEVRRLLVRLQRAAANHDIVTEGRDQGTVVFPNAECKIFLTASVEHRAQRRLRDLQAQGEPATLDEVIAAQQSRDDRDYAREVGPLARADDAVEVCTDGLSVEQVVDRIETLVRNAGETPDPAGRF